MTNKIRQGLKSIGVLRSTVYFCRAVKDRWKLGDKPDLDASLNDYYAVEDPWSYTTSTEESDRFTSALNLLDVTRNGECFERAFEIGCAEGVFTIMLTSRCKSLIAVDIAPAALNRAKLRCEGKNVEIKQWDLFESPAPAAMDLVVIMDVLEMFFRPRYIRIARDKLVATLRPGGYLLLGNSRQNAIFETSWWGKWMLRGGKRIAECFASHLQLELVVSEASELYVNTIFRKKLNVDKPLVAQKTV